MATNKRVVDILDDNEYGPASKIVSVLIEHGFIEADEMTEPERFAQGARNWISSLSTVDDGPKAVFNSASGWSTDSWETVMSFGQIDREKINHPDKIRNIFAALVILAKEAGEL